MNHFSFALVMNKIMTDDVAEKKIIDYASLDMCMLSYVKIDID